jgi:hypothetical protein
MIPLTPFPLIRQPYGAQESSMSANLQIFTLRRVFLTAPSTPSRDNENHGGNFMKRSILLNFNQIAWTVSFFAIRMAILLI